MMVPRKLHAEIAWLWTAVRPRIIAPVAQAFGYFWFSSK